MRLRPEAARRAARSRGAVFAPLCIATTLIAAAPGAAPAPAPRAPAIARPEPPPPTLGPHAPALEGTWELVSMKLPDGSVLKPPVARGVIVIEKGVYLAASYLQPTSARTVGAVWEGQLIIEGDRFSLVPKTGYSYDSMAEPRSQQRLPPPTSGVVARTAGALVFSKDGGGTVTFPAAGGTRRQEDPDGLVLEHVRTSLVPRIPADLPGRDKPRPQ